MVEVGVAFVSIELLLQVQARCAAWPDPYSEESPGVFRQLRSVCGHVIMCVLTAVIAHTISLLYLFTISVITIIVIHLSVRTGFVRKETDM